MGVRTTITVYAPSEETASSAAAAAFDRIGELDGIMSDYRPTSELMRLCARAGGGAMPVSADLFEILAESQRIARASAGAFDVTIGPAVRMWRAARTTGRLPSAENLARVRELVGWRKVRLDPSARTVELAKPGMMLDLGGIAKGYAAQRAVEVLKGRGLGRCLVALSGDIVAGEPPPAPPGEVGWRIAVGAAGEGRTREMLLLANGAVSTAGDEEQFVEIAGVRYSHIVDPGTMLGMTAHRRVTVVSMGPRGGDWADGLDTPWCVLGAERGRVMLGEFGGVAGIVEEEGKRTVVDPGGIFRWGR
jgi:thiamine biosynthesis lipoprotein